MCVEGVEWRLYGDAFRLDGDGEQGGYLGGGNHRRGCGSNDYQLDVDWFERNGLDRSFGAGYHDEQVALIRDRSDIFQGFDGLFVRFGTKQADLSRRFAVKSLLSRPIDELKLERRQHEKVFIVFVDSSVCLFTAGLL